jgi:ubiquinol-cytochrome c reductase iron-sulfur subunit
MSTDTETPHHASQHHASQHRAGQHRADQPDFDVDDPALTRFELVREGARRDGVEIVYYAPRFPVPGTKAERRIERTLALLFLLAGAAATAFLVIYIWWPWKYELGQTPSKLYTPLLGATMGLTLLFIGLAIIGWAKKLLPEEVAVQERHPDGAPDDERKLTSAALLNLNDELGIPRRPLLRRAALLGLLPVGALAVAPIVGGLLKSPHDGGPVLFKTGWEPRDGRRIRMTREDGSTIRPEDISVGGQLTVFPGIPGGTSNEYADSPVLLIHLRAQDADKLRENLAKVSGNRDSTWGSFVAYSKICTHAGCPASLFEQQTNRLLCPCHQSQFNILDNASPIFGPATRPLPMLPLDVEDGVFVAKSDFGIAIGPAFWERP